MKQTMFRIMIVALLGMTAYSAFAENVVITTTYPSPYGKYSNMLSVLGSAYLGTLQNATVSIGTPSSADKKLNVQGNMEIGGAMRFGQLSGAHVHIITNTGYGLQISSNNAGQYADNGIHLASGSGRVGIGKGPWSAFFPQYTLHLRTQGASAPNPIGFTQGGRKGPLRLYYNNSAGRYYCIANYS